MARKPTKSMLEAQIAVLQGTVQEQSATIRRQSQEIAQLRDQLAVHARVPQLSFAALQAQCRKLTADGVPCKIHHGHIVHAKTGAILV